MGKKRMPGKLTEYKDTTFKSTYEAETAKEFDKSGIEWEYESRRLPYLPKVAYYKIDFMLKWPWPENSYCIIETKGYFDPVSRAKMIQVCQQYPNLDIRMMFQNPNLKTNPDKKYTYTEWAERHNIPWTTVEKLKEEYAQRLKEKKKHDRTQRSKSNRAA